MTTPWIDEAVTAFGRQMGLQGFALNESGAAGVNFENGVTVRLEYATEALVVRAGVKVPAEPQVLARALQAAHPSAQGGGFRVRTVRLAKSGEVVFLVRLPEREVSVTTIEAAFRRVWEEAVRLGRSAA